NINYWNGRTTAFIELVSASTTETLRMKNLQIIGNQFKSSSGVAESIRCRTAGVATVIEEDVFIKDNVFMRVSKRAAQVSVSVQGLSAVSSATVDLSPYKIPGCLSDHVNVISCTPSGTGGYITGISRSADLFTINFSAAFTGKVTLAATMSTNGAW